ncbi:Nucleosomal histone H3-Lys79 methylase [Borealophlyctis nickersoniae]|nr:Nucleosomal histone H3-Lys79 methylase [Borealophlyctis nickersoniae]
MPKSEHVRITRTTPPPGKRYVYLPVKQQQPSVPRLGTPSQLSQVTGKLELFQTPPPSETVHPKDLLDSPTPDSAFAASPPKPRTSQNMERKSNNLNSSRRVPASDDSCSSSDIDQISMDIHEGGDKLRISSSKPDRIVASDPSPPEKHAKFTNSNSKDESSRAGGDGREDKVDTGAREDQAATKWEQDNRGSSRGDKTRTEGGVSGKRPLPEVNKDGRPTKKQAIAKFEDKSANESEDIGRRSTSIALLNKDPESKKFPKYQSEKSKRSPGEQKGESPSANPPDRDGNLLLAKKSREVASSTPRPDRKDRPREKVGEATKGRKGGSKPGARKDEPKKDHRYLSKRAMNPCIDAADVVRDNLRLYSQLADGFPRAEADFETVELEYPGAKAKEIYPLLVPRKTGEYNPLSDIYSTTQAIVQYCLTEKQAEPFGDTRTGILRSIIKACHRKNAADLKVALKSFNECMVALKSEGAFDLCETVGKPAKYPFVSLILEQAYARAVAPSAHLLNQYEGFSNNVYGEVRHHLVNEMIKEAGIRPDHVFLDMGSGIGNVVLQVAAQCLCDCYGIEIMPTPAQLGKKQRAEFLSRLRYYAKPCGRITLKQGDFLDDPEIHEVLKRADVIFVNNYAFDAELNQGILAKFLDLKESATVISLRSFVPVDRRPSLRRSNAIESIFTVREVSI